MAYKQYLESYFTVSLPSMAATFGVRRWHALRVCRRACSGPTATLIKLSWQVSIDFLDRELSDLVACGRLSCKIDKVRALLCGVGYATYGRSHYRCQVRSVVESNRPDTRNALYQQTIKQVQRRLRGWASNPLSGKDHFFCVGLTRPVNGYLVKICHGHAEFDARTQCMCYFHSFSPHSSRCLYLNPIKSVGI